METAISVPQVPVSYECVHPATRRRPATLSTDGVIACSQGPRVVVPCELHASPSHYSRRWRPEASNAVTPAPLSEAPCVTYVLCVQATRSATPWRKRVLVLQVNLDFHTCTLFGRLQAVQECAFNPAKGSRTSGPMFSEFLSVLQSGSIQYFSESQSFYLYSLNISQYVRRRRHGARA